MTLREITNAWSDEGFVERDAQEVQGERRSLWIRYEAAVDWSYRPHLDRVLRVYEILLPARIDPDFDSFIKQLRRDGLETDEYGRLIFVVDGTADGPRLINGRYLLDADQLGSGGFGVVYAATDKMARFGDPERVALKMLREDALQDDQAVARFRHEIRLQTKLRHPNLIAVLDTGESSEDGHWYVTQLAVEGSLKKFVDGAGAGLDATTVLHVIRGVAAGVQHLHTMDTLHRDLSPGNVLSLDGNWVVADFGLSVSETIHASYVTSTGVNHLGTPAFTSPEQMTQLKSATKQSDIYGLGKLLQYMVSGEWPTHQPSPSLPAYSVIAKATNVVPSQRHSSVNDFLAAVEIALSPVPSHPESKADRADRYREGLRAGRATVENLTEVMGWLLGLDPTRQREDVYLISVLSAAQQQTLKRMWRADPILFKAMLVSFGAAVLAARLTFEQVDVPARVIFDADAVSTDPEVRHGAISTLADLGRSYNRYFVRTLILRMLQATRPGNLIEPTISGLREAGATDWVLAESDPDDFGPHLRGWLRQLIDNQDVQF